jgi:hypothetical protein
MQIAETSIKSLILKTIAEMPADMTFDDAMEQIFFLSKIQQGLNDMRDGHSFSHDDVLESLKRKWQK